MFSTTIRAGDRRRASTSRSGRGDARDRLLEARVLA
jgi:hypothetical protein